MKVFEYLFLVLATSFHSVKVRLGRWELGKPARKGTEILVTCPLRYSMARLTTVATLTKQGKIKETMTNEKIKELEMQVGIHFMHQVHIASYLMICPKKHLYILLLLSTC